MSARTTFYVSVRRMKAVDDVIEVQAVTSEEARELAMEEDEVLYITGVCHESERR